MACDHANAQLKHLWAHVKVIALDRADRAASTEVSLYQFVNEVEIFGLVGTMHKSKLVMDIVWV